MPAYTSPDNIQYPVSTDQVAPLETVFANMAQRTQNAINSVGANWTSFTPTWTSLTLGNGTQDCSYVVIGQLVYAKYYVSFGSTTSITGALAVQVPTTQQGSSATNATMGQGTFSIS